jgi:peroxiredoxin
LREDIDRFTAAGTTVVAVAPDTPEGVARFIRDRDFPFPLLADVDHTVFDAYDVVNRMASLGQRPAVFVIDHDGTVRFDSIGTQQWQIPSNDAVLALIATL